MQLDRSKKKKKKIRWEHVKSNELIVVLSKNMALLVDASHVVGAMLSSSNSDDAPCSESYLPTEGVNRFAFKGSQHPTIIELLETIAKVPKFDDMVSETL